MISVSIEVGCQVESDYCIFLCDLVKGCTFRGWVGFCSCELGIDKQISYLRGCI